MENHMNPRLNIASTLFLLIVAYASLLTLTGCATPLDRGPDRAEVTPVAEGCAVGAGSIGFAECVYPVLESTCGGCHSGAGKGAFGLGSSASEAYAKVSALVSPDNPDDSKLLKKGSGLESHGGGSPLTQGSNEYMIIQEWISAGAANN